MPPGFAFPINNRVWTPLRLDPSEFAVGRAPPIYVFGRLAPEATIREASAQLAVVGQRAAASYPDTHGNVHPQIYPYTQELVSGPLAWLLYLVQVCVSMILVVIAINVAALVYARTMTRLGEIAVRTALGASRARIASQLFAEAFLLSSVAAAVGLFTARFGLHRFELFERSSQGEAMPFWWDFDLSSSALVYGFGLAVLAAAIIGVAPALGATGRRLRTRLQSVGTGASGPQLGRTWTVLIVLQIAAAVAILPIAMGFVGKWIASEGAPESVFPLDEVLTTRLELDQDAWGSEAVDSPERYAILRDELVSRLEADPQVSHVAMIGTPPPWLDPDLPFELDQPAAAPLGGTPFVMESAATGHRVGRSMVSPELFSTFDIPVLAGRTLNAGDASAGSMTAVVNLTFVELVLGGRSALGRRIRFPTRSDPSLGSRSPLVAEGAPWYTIVGVIPDFPGSNSAISNPEAKAYLPMTIDEEVRLSVPILFRRLQ